MSVRKRTNSLLEPLSPNFENPIETSKPHKQDIKRRRRRWIACTTATALFVCALIVAGTFGSHHVMQQAMDRVTLTFDHMNITNPDPNGSGFFVAGELVAENVMYPGATMHSSVVDLIFEGRAFGKMATPKIVAYPNKQNHVTLSLTRVNITNPTVWRAASKAIMTNKQVTWGMEGTTTVTVLSFIHFSGVQMSKRVVLDAVDNMRNVFVGGLSMTTSNSTAIKMQATICVDNPSRMRMADVGDLISEVQYNSTSKGLVTLGSALSPAASLFVMTQDRSADECLQFAAHGLNALTIEGVVTTTDQEVLTEVMNRLVAKLPTTLIAQVTSIAGAGRMVYGGAVSGLQISATVTNGLGRPLVRDLTFDRVDMQPVSDSSVSLTFVSKAIVDNPLGAGCPMNVTQTRLRVAMYALNETHPQGEQLLGVITTDWIPIAGGTSILGSGSFQIDSTGHNVVLDVGSYLGAFVGHSITACNVSIRVEGTADAVATVPALPFPLTMLGIVVKFPDQELGTPAVQMPGMCGLKDTAIQNFALSDPEGGRPWLQLRATASIFNPSPFSMFVGDLACELRLPVFPGDTVGVLVGEMLTPNLTLRAGANVVAMVGHMEASDEAARQAIERMMTSTMTSNEALPILARGKRASSGSLANVPWVQSAMEAFAIEVMFQPNLDIEHMVSAATVNAIHLAFDTSGQPLLGGSVSATMQMFEEVRHVSLNVLAVGGEMETRTSDGRLVSTMQLAGDTPVQFIHAASAATAEVLTTFANTTLHILDTEAFTSLMTSTLEDDAVQLQLTGKTTALVACAVGVLRISGVPFSVNITVPGMRGLSNMSVISVDISKTSSSEVVMSSTVEVNNPTTMSASMGAVDFWLVRDGEAVARVNIPEFDLQPGVSRFTNVIATYTLNEPEPQNPFMSDFVRGLEQTVLLTGRRESTAIELLQGSLAVLSHPTRLPGVTELFGTKLLGGTILTFPSNTLNCMLGSQCLVPTQVKMSNPFSVPVIVRNATTEIFECIKISQDGKQCLGGYKPTSMGMFTPQPNIDVEIPPHGATWSAPFPVYVYGSVFNSFQTMMASSVGTAVVAVSGTLTVQIGEFVQTVKYSADDVPTCLNSIVNNCVGEIDWEPPTWTDADCTWDTPKMRCAHPAYCQHQWSLANPFRCVLRAQFKPE